MITIQSMLSFNGPLGRSNSRKSHCGRSRWFQAPRSRPEDCGVPDVPGSSNCPAGVPEAGAATPVYAENAVYAVCAPCVNDSLSAVSAVSAPCGNADSLQEFEQLAEAKEAAGVDITSDYNDWYKIAIAIANIFI